MADYLRAGLHPRCLSGTFEQALTLRHLIRAEIGIAGLVAYRGDHPPTARDFYAGFPFAAFEAAVEAEPRPGLRKIRFHTDNMAFGLSSNFAPSILSFFASKPGLGSVKKHAGDAMAFRE